MRTMESTAFIWNIILSIWVLSACCKCHTLNSKTESDIIKDSNTTTHTKNNVQSKNSHKTLVLCKCHSGEIMDDTGQCQPWADGTSVPVGEHHQRQQNVNTKKFNVTVHDIECQYKQVDIQDGQFILRHRGDLLVTDGALQGLRLADYCIHHQVSEGKSKVTAKGCVSVPLVPKCCAEGKHMENGVCAPKTLNVESFKPSLATGPHGENGLAGAHFPLVEQQEYLSMPNCSAGHFIKKVKLDWQNAYLAMLPENVLLTWQPDGKNRLYSLPPEYCVDGPENDDSYFAYFCHKDLKSYCKDKSCLKKCCPKGNSLSTVYRSCVPSDSSFESLLPSSGSLTILHGWPSCAPVLANSNYTLSSDGTLLTEDYTYSFDEFCIDNFISESSTEPEALVCAESIKETLWHSVRKELFPVCIGLSCAFLILLLLLNAWIPKLWEKEDSNLLFHAASLLVAFSVSLIMQILVPMGYIMDDKCLALAFVMQFAFLSAFFWLNTMCFDMWRLSRNLVCNNCSPVPPIAVWKYLLYAAGGPLIITVTTIIVQFTAPLDGSIPWLVHPRIGEGRCWFHSGAEMLAYFYGPIAVLFSLNFLLIGITYYYLRIMRGDYKSANNPRKLDFFAAYWQRFYLLALVTGCWLTEILSWKIPPEELWAATDILNNLQGVFVFLVFISPSSKRALIKDKLQKLCQCSNTISEQMSIKESTKRLSKTISSDIIITQNDNRYIFDKE